MGGGGKSRGGGGGGSVMPSPYEMSLANIANELYGSTGPLRKSFIGDWQKILSGNYDPSQLPTYQPLYEGARSGLEGQYNVARQNLISTVPRGGSMNEAMKELEMTRAESVGALPAQISTGLIQDMMNKAYGAAWNAPATSISGLGAANQGYTSRAIADMQAQAASRSSKGSGLGMLGMGLGGVLGSVFGGPLGGALGSSIGGMGGRGVEYSFGGGYR